MRRNFDKTFINGTQFSMWSKPQIIETTKAGMARLLDHQGQRSTHTAFLKNLTNVFYVHEVSGGYNLRFFFIY